MDRDGKPVLRRQLRRSEMLEFFHKLPGCLVGMEACSGAHYRARELIRLGHEVRLMQPSYVKGYVKRGSEADQKTIRWIVFPPNDAADAEAICEGPEPVAQRSPRPVDGVKAKDARQR